VLEREVLLARRALAEAGLAALNAAGDSDEAGLRRKYELRLRRFDDHASSAAKASADGDARHPTRRALEAERHALSSLRARGVIGDDAFHRVEEELDWAELNADAKLS
jgi:monovalent cation/hydrogen antiporter